MSYNTDLPPKIVRTNQSEGATPDDWELRTASGSTIQTYNTVTMSIHVWWPDLLAYIRDNASSVMDAIEDLSLLMVQSDWIYRR